MNPEQLVIFDYSGTLSHEAVLFARPDSLMKHLHESGLFNLGIDSLDCFWREIVSPTWEEGSTTGIGYAGLIVKRLLELSPDRGSNASPHDLTAAAIRFVTSYLSHSAPDQRWQPLLTKLVSHPHTCVIIATDHYAEATDYIIHFLEHLEIPAKPVRELTRNAAGVVAVVANSANLGYPKMDRRFWEILKTQLTLQNIRRVLYVDDFGHNESEGDDYGSIAKVEARKEKTVAILRKVFPVEVTALAFLLRSESSQPNNIELAYGDLINAMIQQIEDWMIKC